MKKRGYMEKQILGFLKQADAGPRPGEYHPGET